MKGIKTVAVLLFISMLVSAIYIGSAHAVDDFGNDSIGSIVIVDTGVHAGTGGLMTIPRETIGGGGNTEGYQIPSEAYGDATEVQHIVTNDNNIGQVTASALTAGDLGMDIGITGTGGFGTAETDVTYTWIEGKARYETIDKDEDYNYIIKREYGAASSGTIWLKQYSNGFIEYTDAPNEGYSIDESLSGWYINLETGERFYNVYCKADTFAIHHSSNDETREYLVADYPDGFNLTENVIDGYLYVGVYNKDYTEALTYVSEEGDSGLNFVPYAGQDVYVKEVLSYLYGGVSMLTVSQQKKVGGEDKTFVTNIFAFMDLPGSDYLAYGVNGYIRDMDTEEEYEYDGVVLGTGETYKAIRYNGTTIKTARTDDDFVGLCEIDFGDLYKTLTPENGSALAYVSNLNITINSVYVTADMVAVHRITNYFLAEDSDLLTLVVFSTSSSYMGVATGEPDEPDYY